MARLGQNFSRFRGDNFTIVFNVMDATNIVGYKAEWSIYTRDVTGINHKITRHLTLTTSDHFFPPGEGQFFPHRIILKDGEVHIPITKDDYRELGSSGTQITFEHQLRLWDRDNLHAVAAQGTWTVMVPTLPLQTTS